MFKLHLNILNSPEVYCGKKIPDIIETLKKNFFLSISTVERNIHILNQGLNKISRRQRRAQFFSENLKIPLYKRDPRGYKNLLGIIAYRLPNSIKKIQIETNFPDEILAIAKNLTDKSIENIESVSCLFFQNFGINFDKCSQAFQAFSKKLNPERIIIEPPMSQDNSAGEMSINFLVKDQGVVLKKKINKNSLLDEYENTVASVIKSMANSKINQIEFWSYLNNFSLKATVDPCSKLLPYLPDNIECFSILVKNDVYQKSGKILLEKLAEFVPENRTTELNVVNAEDEEKVITARITKDLDEEEDSEEEGESDVDMSNSL